MSDTRKYQQRWYLVSVFTTYVGNSCSFIVCGKASLDAFGIASVFGGMLLLEQLKALFLSAAGGAIVERLGARRVATTCDLALFIIGGVFAWIASRGHLGWAVIGTLFFINIVKPLYSAATFALVVGIADSNQAHEVNAKSAAAQQLGYFVGLAVAGVLLTVLPPPALLLLDALTYLASALMLARINNETRRTSEVPAAKRPGVLRSYVELLRSTPGLLKFTLGIAIQINLIVAYNSCLFKMVAERFPSTPAYLSVFEAAYASAIIAISLLVGRIPALKISAARIWPLFAIQTMLLGSFAISLPAPVLAIGALLFGAISSLVFPACFSALYDRTPDSQVGSVGGLKGVVQAISALPLLLVNGLLLDLLGTSAAYLWMSAVSAAFAVFLALTASPRNLVQTEGSRV